MHNFMLILVLERLEQASSSTINCTRLVFLDVGDTCL